MQNGTKSSWSKKQIDSQWNETETTIELVMAKLCQISTHLCLGWQFKIALSDDCYLLWSEKYLEQTPNWTMILLTTKVKR